MANSIAYNGSDKWKIKATQLLNQGGSGSGGGSLSLNGRKFIFIGDSYQEGWTDSSGTTVIIDSWLDYFISWYGSQFDGYYRNEAGGWGFAKENCQFITLLQALESTITDKADITDIVVEGGYNDHAWLSGIDAAILTFKNYAIQTYPNANLWIAPVSRGINQFEADADSAHKIYIDSGMKYGFNICGEITRAMLNESYYSTDLVHPTAEGYRQICKYMHQCLTTGSCDLLIGYAKEDDIETNYYTKNDIDRALQSKANTSDLATVATSGSYSDLTDQPSVYTKTEVNNLLDDKQDSLIGGAISSGDLDDYTTIGHYYVSSAGSSVVSNLPVALAGYLEVVQPSTTSDGARVQRYTAISSNAVVGVYERNYNSGSWQTWVRIDVESLLGGNITSGNLNTIRTVGNYYVSSTNVSNIPISAIGMLEVVAKDTSTTTAVIQRYTAIENNVIVGVYERVYVGNAWRAWTHIGDDVYLPLSGGTLTDNLTVSKTSDPYVIVKNTDITVDSSATNGVSSTETAQVVFRDSTDVYFARIYGDADTSGNINARIQARNMKAGTSTRYSATIRATVDKNGDIEFATAASSNDSNVTYSIVKPANFRSAIRINDEPTISNSNGTATSVATATDVTLNSRTLGAGVWLITYKVQFGANASGYRRAYLVTNETSSTPLYQSRLTQPAVNSSSVDTEITMTNNVNLSESTTIYLRCRQNSGSTLSCTGALRCVRLNAAT